MTDGPVSFVLKQTFESLYKATSIGDKSFRLVDSIIICNTAATSRLVYLSITDTPTNPIKGAIFYGLIIDANETITLSSRRIILTEQVMAKADVGGQVSISFDVKPAA